MKLPFSFFRFFCGLWNYWPHYFNWLALKMVGMSLHWFSSYLSNQKFFSSANGKTSTCAPLTCSPQGSILGPILFLLYMLPLAHNPSVWLCALWLVHGWYTNLFIWLFKFNHTVQVYDWNWKWMSFFQLNHRKTEGLVFALDHVSSKILQKLRHYFWQSTKIW